jgi:hypothetical protein
MTMILSGLEFLISICDLNGSFPLRRCSVLVGLVTLLWWTFLPVKPLFACLGSLLMPMTFALRGIKDLYTTWQGIGWFASEGQGCERDMHEVGAWESQQFYWNRASYVALSLP